MSIVKDIPILGDITRDTFDKDKNYHQMIFQKGKPILDSEMNEWQNIDWDFLKVWVDKIFGNSFIGDAFVLDESSITTVNNFAIRAGEAYVNGVKVYNPSLFQYNEQAFTDDFLQDLFWDNTTVPVLTTPSGGDRNDLVVLSLVVRQVDSTMDTNLINPDLAQETAIRWKVEYGITVFENVGTYPETTDYELLFTYKNDSYCFRVPIGWLERQDGNANISISMIRDIRDIVYEEGKTLYDKISEEFGGGVGVSNKLSKFRGTNAPIYPVDEFYYRGTVLKRNVQLTDISGIDLEIFEQEQVYPVSRVDQKQEDTTGAVGYGVEQYGVFTESSPHRILFNPSDTLLFSENHNRMGFHIKSLGINYTDLRITLHDDTDTLRGEVDIPYANLILNWQYIDIVYTLPDLTKDYHYHITTVGATGGYVAPYLSMDSGDSIIAFRQFYLPDSGKYGSINEEDILILLDRDGAKLVSVRSAGDDDIISPGDGYIGETGLDIIAVDFSNDTFWESWSYNDYIGIDLLTGRISCPSSIDVRLLYGEFNIFELLDITDAKNFFRHEQERSIEDSVSSIEDDFNGHQVEFIDFDESTSINDYKLGESSVVVFPSLGAPKGSIQLLSRENGLILREIIFLIKYAMSLPLDGVVKLDLDIWVDGVSITSRTVTIDPENTVDRQEILTDRTNLYIDITDFDKDADVVIDISRDNTVVNNHIGDFYLIGLKII